MRKISVVAGLNFALALLAAFVSGFAAGVIISMLTAGWIYAWRRKLIAPVMTFRILSIQFCVCNMLIIWHWRAWGL